jgi:CBS domain-containing protein
VSTRDKEPLVIALADVLDQPVRGIMRHGVVSVPEHATLESVFRAMADHRVHAVLVTPRGGGRPLGWVTAKAVLTWMNLDSSAAQAHQAIQEPAVTIAPDAPVGRAIEVLSRPGVTHLLVCDEGTDAGEGVITPLDVIAATGR